MNASATVRVAGLAILSTALGCAAPSPLDDAADPVDAAEAFVDDPVTRRAALEASVAPAPDVAYAVERLEHYAVDGPESWDRLDVWRPDVRPLRIDGSDDAPTAPVADLGALATLDDWVREGRRAYLRYPAQVDLAFDALREPGVAEAHGLAVDPDGTVHGAVELLGADDRWLVGLTCAACHDAVREDGEVIAGASNTRVRFGELLGTRDFRRGTMDVTGDGVFNPVRPSDLRAISLQARLHHAANLANGRVARMVRIETLIGSRGGWVSRPDRRMVAAISLYLDSLAEGLPRPDPSDPGAAVFGRTCARCHAGEAMAGPGVSVDVVGTDPAAATGSRGIGLYRAPSLLGVGDRGALLHDASAPTLEALLGLAERTHRGHAFGLERPETERRALIEHLAL